MSFRLRMSAEIGDWLAELRLSDPVAATEVGAALVAIMNAAELSSLALVGEPATQPVPDLSDPREAVDCAYQSQLEALQKLRREAVDAGVDARRAEQRLSQRESEPAADADVLAQFRRQLDGARQRERELTERSQRVQAQVDAFRTRKETAKALYTAAEASVRVHEALDAVDSLAEAGPDDDSAATVSSTDGPGTGDGSAPAPGSDESAELNRTLAAAEANLRAVLAEAGRTMRDIGNPPGPTDTGSRAAADQATPAADGGGRRPVPGLLELRADPLGTDIRILFAAEPQDTVMLLAILEGDDAIRDHRDVAIDLAGDLLTQIRAGDWPPEDAEAEDLTFADPAAFLERFFPDAGDRITQRAGALANTCTLADLRGRRDMNLADLATATGISGQLQAIEQFDLRSATLRELAVYLRALGGRLELSAVFDDEQDSFC